MVAAVSSGVVVVAVAYTTFVLRVGGWVDGHMAPARAGLVGSAVPPLVPPSSRAWLALCVGVVWRTKVMFWGRGTVALEPVSGKPVCR